MIRTSLIRSLAAKAALCALLFSHLALAAYACPMDNMAMAETEQTAECCAESARGMAGLCQEHCKDSAAKVAEPADSLPDFSPAFVATLQLAQPHQQAREYSQAVLAHAASPPLSILNCCFRI
jgi:hypothetical protein